MQETQVQSLIWEDPLEKERATHSSILAWRTPWTEEPDGLQFMGLQKVGCNLANGNNKTFKCWKLPLFFFFAHKIILFIFSYFQVFARVLISNHSPTSSHSETYHASITYKLTMDLFFSNAVCIITCTTLFCTQIFC